MAKKATENKNVKKLEIADKQETDSKSTTPVEKIETVTADVSHLMDKVERSAHELFRPRERGQIIGKGPSIMGN